MTYYGAAMAVTEIFFVIGKAMPTLIAIKLGPPDDPDSVFMMKVILGFPLILTILTIFNFCFVFSDRTPKFAMSKNQLEEVRKFYNKIYKEEFIEDKI
jgi:hypothetical protein